MANNLVVAEPQPQSDALDILEQLGRGAAPALPALCGMMAKAEPAIAVDCALLIGDIGNDCPEVLSALQDTAGDQALDPRVRIAAAAASTALGRLLGLPLEVAVAAAGLGDLEEEDDHSMAHEVWGADADLTGDTAPSEPITCLVEELLRSKRELEIADQSAIHDDERWSNVLRDTVESSGHSMREGNLAGHRESEDDRRSFAAAIWHLSDQGLKEAAPLLRRIALEGPANLRCDAVAALGRSALDDDIRVLSELVLSEEIGPVWGLAAQGLGELHDIGLVRFLLRGVCERKSEVSEWECFIVADSLRHLSASQLAELTPQLRSAVREGPACLVGAAVWALGRAGLPEDVQLVGGLLLDKGVDSDTRRAAAKALGALGDPSGKRFLLKALGDLPENEGDLRGAFVDGLSALVGRLEERQSAGLPDKSGTERHPI